MNSEEPVNNSNLEISEYCSHLTNLLRIGYECFALLHARERQKPVEYIHWRNLLENKCQQLSTDESRWIYNTLVSSPIKSLPQLELLAKQNLSFSQPIPVLMAGTRLVFQLKNQTLVAELITPLCMKRFKPPRLQCCPAAVKVFLPNPTDEKEVEKIQALVEKAGKYKVEVQSDRIILYAPHLNQALNLASMAIDNCFAANTYRQIYLKDWKNPYYSNSSPVYLEDVRKAVESGKWEYYVRKQLESEEFERFYEMHHFQVEKETEKETCPSQDFLETKQDGSSKNKHKPDIPDPFLDLTTTTVGFDWYWWELWDTATNAPILGKDDNVIKKAAPELVMLRFNYEHNLKGSTQKWQQKEQYKLIDTFDDINDSDVPF